MKETIFNSTQWYENKIVEAEKHRDEVKIRLENAQKNLIEIQKMKNELIEVQKELRILRANIEK